jgi:hypothetical protein
VTGGVAVPAAQWVPVAPQSRPAGPPFHPQNTVGTTEPQSPPGPRTEPTPKANCGFPLRTGPCRLLAVANGRCSHHSDTLRCTGRTHAGAGCRMPRQPNTTVCAWHGGRIKRKPKPEPVGNVAMVSARDRKLLGPRLAQLALWAREYDRIGADVDEPLSTAADFADWLRVELAIVSRQ